MGVGYILRQIEGQRLAIVEPEATARAFGTEIGRLLSADAGRFAGADMRRYREMIGRYARENGVVLWREAWEAIDRENDVERFAVIAVLAALPESPIYSSKLH
ncbi:hypothetical protein [Endothiovibrio diazotrophicus]